MTAPFDGPQHEGVRRAFLALAPALDRILVVGGFAQALFASRPEAQSLPEEPLITEDLGLLLPEDGLTLVTSSDVSLTERLKSQGFVERVTGTYGGAHAVFEYSGRSPFRAEYLVHRFESSQARWGDVTRARVQGDGLHALPLPHLRLLAHEPWEVEFYA